MFNYVLILWISETLITWGSNFSGTNKISDPNAIAGISIIHLLLSYVSFPAYLLPISPLCIFQCVSSTLRLSAAAARASIAVCGASLQLCVRWVLAHNSGCVNRTIFFSFSKKFVKLTKLDIRELVLVKAAVLFAFKVNLRSPLKPQKSWPSENKNCVKTAQTHKKIETTTKKIMVSRRKILSRSRDELHSDIYFMAEDDDEDVWYSKEKLYRVSSIIFSCFSL